MAKIDFGELYRIQEMVFPLLVKADTSFFLTGGTCLHRFYCNKRYSDDLDFFTNENNLFRDDCRLFLGILRSAQIEYETIVDSRDFMRLLIQDLCKVDLVNDRVYRFGKTVEHESGLRLDNIHNILANKMCAIISRDEPKDVFDLITIFYSQDISWPDICAAANKKCVLDRELLEFRLRSFPVAMLDMLSVIDLEFLTAMKGRYAHIIGKIIDSMPA